MGIKMKGICRVASLISFVWLLVSCNSVKYVSEGDYLLDKSVIVSDNKDIKPSELKSYLRQQPNFRVFGLLRWQLYVYGWSGRNEDRWLSKQLRRIGEAPVILDTMLVQESEEQLRRFLVNKGYTGAEVTAVIDTTRTQKALVTYYIESNEPYKISHYTMWLSDPKIDSIAHLKPPPRPRIASPFRSLTDDYNSLVKEGNLFDRDVLDKERQRVSTLLRRRGYYAFNRDFLHYLADTVPMDHTVDLEMRLRPYRRYLTDGTVEEGKHNQYYINKVTILTDYDPLRMEGDIFTPTDTIRIGDIDIVYGENGRTLRPGVLRRANYIRPGRLYSSRTEELTYSAFSSMRALRSVNVRFQEFMENDTMKLNATILTAPAKVHGVGVDLEGTNSGGDFGVASSMNYQHRNLFKGSEIFSARVRGAYEILRKSKGQGSYWEIGGETSLTFPHFVFPFLQEDFKRRLRATTEFRLSYNQQTRPVYRRAILSGGWSYSWQNRTNNLARHTFKLLDVDYLYVPYISSGFLDSIPQITRKNYTNQFIVGMGYNYTYNDFNPQNRQRNNQSFRISLEVAGNFLYALSKITNQSRTFNEETGELDDYKLFGIEYSQFFKGDFDYSKGYLLDSRNRFAFHIGVGVAYPYGNSTRIPFEKRYFSGGANSVRGWSVRSLGPGSMVVDSINRDYRFAVQAGDVRLDANVEYRTKLFWKFELATYIDAGNIWTIRKYDDQVKGNFDFSRFYKEIALSYGFGLRLDFDYFLLRLDSGFKAYDPQVPKGKRWVIKNPNFHDNFALHFAVGYPF